MTDDLYSYTYVDFCPSCLRSIDVSMYSVDLLISPPHSSSFTLIFFDLQVLQLESILEPHWCGKGEKKPPMITLKHRLWWALDFSVAFTCILSSLCFSDTGRPAALGFSDGYKSHAEYLAKPSVSFLGPRMGRNELELFCFSFVVPIDISRLLTSPTINMNWGGKKKIH